MQARHTLGTWGSETSLHHGGHRLNEVLLKLEVVALSVEIIDDLPSGEVVVHPVLSVRAHESRELEPAPTSVDDLDGLIERNVLGGHHSDPLHAFLPACRTFVSAAFS